MAQTTDTKIDMPKNEDGKIVSDQAAKLGIPEDKEGDREATHSVEDYVDPSVKDK